MIFINEMTAIACRNIEITAASIPSLENGAGVVATIPIREAAIAVPFHWLQIPGVARLNAVEYTRAYVRAYYGVLGAAAVRERNANAGQAVVVATGPAAHANLTAAGNLVATMPMVRKQAMCLGAVRAGMMRMWNVDPNHLIVTETSAAQVLHLNNGNMETIHAHTQQTFTLSESLAYSMRNMSAEENDVLYALFKLSMAVVPLAGLSLIGTGHHYLSDVPQATNAVMKQVMSVSSVGVKAWFTADAVDIMDMIWHKSAHPVTSAHLIAQALSNEVPISLRDAGLGSAMVRLPYIEPEMKAAKAMVAVVATVQHAVSQVNGRLSITCVVNAIADVNQFAVRGVAANAPVVAHHPNIRTRNAAIAEILRPAVDRATMAVAYAMGVCGAMLDTLPARDKHSTLMNARSLARIRAENLPTVTAGSNFYENLMRRDRNAAANGEVSGPNMVF